MKHSPTPWKLKYDPAMAYSYILDANNNCVLEILSGMVAGKYSDAALIVKAVNTYCEKEKGNG